MGAQPQILVRGAILFDEIARDEGGERLLAGRVLLPIGGKDRVRRLTRDHIGKGLVVRKDMRELNRAKQWPEHVLGRPGLC